MNKKLLITLSIAVFLIFGTLGAIRFAKGYRLNFKNKTVDGTGLLVTNSFPKGASVYINSKLTTATDDTLNLPPGEYEIKIVKDGFISWEKKLLLQEELVTQTNAHLFPAVPDLNALTSSGATNLTPSPDGYKIAFSVASASAKLKNGLWVLDLNSNSLSSSYGTRQISQEFGSIDFSKADILWSPDSQEILVKNNGDTVLLDADRLNQPESINDVLVRLSLILSEWEKELAEKRQKQLSKLPEEMQKIATQSAKNVYFSPDEEKLLYTATASALIKEDLIPSLPASNTQEEERNLQAGRIYVYDLKEDKNFFIAEAEKETAEETKLDKEEDEKAIINRRIKEIQRHYSPLYFQSLQWFPTSKHLVYNMKDKITILEYDNTNIATVYAGPFENSFVYPWPDGSKLAILTTLTPEADQPLNLYAIDLK
ncbi:hypothetical protein COT75_03445 [Candidatus Beckwithbacteria bacterium CG10_big_fil_rev_8_21_14_0_10_34_10]|uniref:PEGA domain-containing protein n=1 Tax=Candidatus Beckwithbacteria bacterium CG10_big_fil_rev_8_21_14_0_10_34_10 TaxID=1974495 RepID=A0A2H0WAX5_9BACT|nr:MAG: hypothetical protein COT75_03445 [Candidatus Beckwithbacteria bacterium CG10_big_fil_rev_8_21_14_0_10_34_10]